MLSTVLLDASTALLSVKDAAMHPTEIEGVWELVIPTTVLVWGTGLTGYPGWLGEASGARLSDGRDDLHALVVACSNLITAPGRSLFQLDHCVLLPSPSWSVSGCTMTSKPHHDLRPAEASKEPRTCCNFNAGGTSAHDLEPGN